MNPVNKSPAEKRGRLPRTITLSLSLPTAVSSVVMLCAAFVCVFFIGILLGRGHSIEENIPQLERIMPQAGPAEQPKLVGHDTATPPAAGKNATAAAADSRKEAPPARTQAPGQPPQSGQAQGRNDGPAEPRKDTVMDQGDLAYRDSLKHKPAPPAPPPAKTPPKTQNTSPENAIFQYVYQVAAYKSQAMSDKLAAKLKKSGIGARTEKNVENGVTRYRTLVDFRGTPDDTLGLRVTLKEHGISRLLLKSKAPVR